MAAGEIEWRAHIHDLNVAVGLVVGETAVIGDDVSILHEVTLGGTGKERGDRHPKVRDVLLCAGAKVLGNVEIGRDAKVGAGSVVLHDVPPRATVAGVPARIVGWSSGSVPALEMDQSPITRSDREPAVTALRSAQYFPTVWSPPDRGFSV